MKFLMVVAIYLSMAFMLGWGILLTVHGKPWLLIAAFLGYALAFAKFGCLPAKTPDH